MNLILILMFLCIMKVKDGGSRIVLYSTPRSCLLRFSCSGSDDNRSLTLTSMSSHLHLIYATLYFYTLLQVVILIWTSLQTIVPSGPKAITRTQSRTWIVGIVDGCTFVSDQCCAYIFAVDVDCHTVL